MKYYKMLNNTMFIGVINSNNFIKEFPNGMILRSNENFGQFVLYKGQFYRDYWMYPPINMNRKFIIAEIDEITQEEYDALNNAIKNNEEILLEEPEEEEPVILEEIIEEEPNITIEFARESKLKEMSYRCHHTIEDGFDIELRNETLHFSLDTQDQLNLMSLNTLADTMNQIPYHADGQECVFYTAEEIHQIVAAANQHKIYHTTYYNALKIYINALQTVEEIAEIYYGIEIPEEYQTEVLKNL